MNVPRPRPPANAPQTLARLLLYLRRTRTDSEGRPAPITQGQLARKLGYHSASVISELEDPEKCRATYEHLERYADYFGVPAGVMLLVTRITAAAKYSSTDANALKELDAVRKSVSALLSNLEPDSHGVPGVIRLLQPHEVHDHAAWERVFERLLADFRRALDSPDIFCGSSARRVRAPAYGPGSRPKK